MKNSLKQILRTPARTALFFLLMTAATLLLVFSASLWSETDQRIDTVETTFTTIGTVEQPPVMADVIAETWEGGCFGYNNRTFGTVRTEDIWDVRVTLDDLLFEGANYVTAPEFRPYYMVEHPDWSHTVATDHWYDLRYHIVEFTALEDSDELGAAWVRVEQVPLKQTNGRNSPTYPPHEGAELFVCQCGGKLDVPNGIVLPLEKGKRYIASVESGGTDSYHLDTIMSQYTENFLTTHHEWPLYQAPYSTQHDKDGNEVHSDWFPTLDDGRQDRYRIEEVTDDFYEEGGRGQNWLRWAKTVNQYDRFFPVLPVDKLHMLPLFQQHRAYLSGGREFTQEELDSGALVCMVPRQTMMKNTWKIGDKISLPLLCSLYGPDARMIRVHWTPDYNVHFYTPYDYFSPIGADGKEYEPFWEAEYEIVGTYDLMQRMDVYTNGEIYPDTILIPQNSVRADDENNIAGYNYFDGKTVTFQIENGTIDQFDAALRAAVPQAGDLIINYNDNGYTEIMESLQGTRAAALLLFIVGLLASIAILLLLLYFFIVKEKKRTAIERSLGMSKRQCRVSLLTGVLVLTILAATLGTLGGAGAMQLANREDQAATETVSEETDVEEVSVEEASLSADDYNPMFSMWAKADKSAQEVDLTATTPMYVYVVIPLALVLLVLVLSLVLINRNLKIEPIYLLSGKME